MRLLMNEMTLDELITCCNSQTNELFTYYLKNSKSPAPLLQEAMYYSVNNGGKRIRPLLVYATGMMLGASGVNQKWANPFPSVINRGKRIRPLLVYATGMMLGATFENLAIAA